VGDRVVDRGTEEDDAVLEQPTVDVEGALAAAGLFEDGGDHVAVGSHSSSSRATTSPSTTSSETTSPTPSGASIVRSSGLPSSSTGLALARITSKALFRRISPASANS